MSLPRSSWILLGASAVLTIFFCFWALYALGDGALLAFDYDVAQHFAETAREHHLERIIMIGFTHSGGIPAMIVLALVGAIWQFSIGDRRLAIGWAVIVLTGGMLNQVLKKSFDRPRPPLERRDAAVTETNESFPSGHSMGSMIGYGMLGFAVLPHLRRRAGKAALIGLLATLVGLIGFSRIYLRAHWFSDVIGGFAIGAAWLAFGLAWVSLLQARSASKSSSNPTS
jgi:membrane-associated phospholipid phosphatase